MANQISQSLLTYGAKVSSVEQIYFSPVAVLPTAPTIPLGTTFCLLGLVTPSWNANTVMIPTPTEDQQSIKQVFKNVFVAKQVQSSEISPVVQRLDWATGNVWDVYDDTLDMFSRDQNGFLNYEFYVKNSFDQIFKCLWNNNGGVSTVEPYFQPGQYSTNNVFQGADGYKWKYIYTIDIGSKVQFMDSSWLPISVGQNTPNPIQTSAGLGSIDVINVTNGGSGYDPANAAVQVVISGDGSGATGTAVVTGGVVTDVVVTNPGTNYNYATVSIQSLLGSGATAVSPTSPIGGHGFDPVSELGCNHVMFTIEFDGNELTDNISMVPTDIKYYQAALVVSPTALSTYPAPAAGAIYKTTTDFIVAQGFGAYQSGETIYQGSSLTNASYTATVLSFDSVNNILHLINTTGSYTTNAPVFGNSSSTVRTLLSVSTPDFVLGSGYLSYVENLPGVQRSSDGIEQFKFVLGF